MRRTLLLFAAAIAAASAAFSALPTKCTANNQWNFTCDPKNPDKYSTLQKLPVLIRGYELNICITSDGKNLVDRALNTSPPLDCTCDGMTNTRQVTGILAYCPAGTLGGCSLTYAKCMLTWSLLDIVNSKSVWSPPCQTGDTLDLCDPVDQTKYRTIRQEWDGPVYKGIDTWCVTSDTGTEIAGTRFNDQDGVNQPKDDDLPNFCTCEGQIAAKIQNGIRAFCGCTKERQACLGTGTTTGYCPQCDGTNSPFYATVQTDSKKNKWCVKSNGDNITDTTVDTTGNCTCVSAGLTFNATTKACQQCAPGTYKASRGTGLCEQCPTLNAAPPVIGQNATTCSCAAGRFFNTTSKACQQCATGSSKISAGTGPCTSCKEGYTTTKIGATSCDTCATGYSRANSEAPCTKSWCDAGNSFNATTKTCQPCATGSFKASSGTGSCIPCSQGTWTSKVGATSCNTCAAGYSGSTSTTCTPCKATMFKDSSGFGSCGKCPTGTTTTISGALSCVCDKGFYLNAQKGGCVQCTGYTFKNNVGNSVQCGACPPGKIPNIGRTDCVVK